MTETDIYPTQVSRSDNGALIISWSNGSEQSIPYKMLRDQCPCATCIEKRIGDTTDGPKTNSNLFPILTAEETRPLAIESMEPVGNYAYRIQFTDGHGTGVYTIEYLRQL